MTDEPSLAKLCAFRSQCCPGSDTPYLAMMAHVGPLGRSRAVQHSFFRLRSAPRALQEALNRLSRAISIEIPFWTPFRTPFRDLKWAPGASKLKFSRETSCDFCDFAAFSSNRFRTPFWARFGLPFGSPLGPKGAETSLGIFSRAV